MESAAWGLIGTIVGALASTFATWLTVRNSSNLQNERARIERQERSNSFQRDTILGLQEALHDVMRLVHRAHFEDRLSLLKGVPWQEGKLSEELDESIREAIRKVALLVERIASQDLRGQVKNLTMAAYQSLFASDENEARARIDQCSSEFNRTNEALGTALRLHY
jgi:hypothetical protein